MFYPNERFVGFQFGVCRDFMSNVFRLYMVHGDDRADITMSKCPEGQSTDPTVALNPVEAQGLFDALWHAGLRPSSKEHVNGVVAAKDDHIKDLRRVLFDVLVEK